MDILQTLWQFPLIVIGLTWLTNSLIKLLIDLQHQSWSWHLLRNSGGMPSGHTALVTSLVAVTFWQKGVMSLEHAIACVLAVIVIHDALKQRRHLDKLTKIINEQQQIDLSTRMGHTLAEVVVGGMIGLLIPTLIFLFQ